MNGRTSKLSRLVRPNILSLRPYRCARDDVQTGLLLDANENPYTRKRGVVQVNRYPDPYQRELRDALAQYLGVRSENVMAGSGSDEVLDWVFKVFCEPRSDQVVIADPTYGMYRVMADIFGVSAVDCLLDSRFEFDADRFLKEVPQEAKVLFLCSPNNPTGNLLDPQGIVKVLSNWSGIVVVDEAYIEFSNGNSFVTRVEEFPTLIVMRTFSKAFGRAGCRLGYAVANEEIIGHFFRVKAPYNLNAMTLAEGFEAVSAVQVTEAEIESIVSERDRMSRILESLPRVETVFPSDANFLLFKIERASEICRSLLDKEIVVRDRSSLPGLADCIRVTIGTPEENEVFMGGLKSCLREVFV